MSKKNIIPKEYRDSNNLVSESQFFGYLKRNEISPTEALEIIIKETTIDTSHPRTQWKLERFQWYLWERDKEWRDGIKSGKKISTIRRVVSSKIYKERYEKYSFNRNKFDEEKEAENLLKLIGDDRQRKYWKSWYFHWKNSKQNIPQHVIDLIR